MCVGENFKDNAPIGDCGDIKSLQEWMRHLTHKDDEFLDRFFDESYKEKILKILLDAWGIGFSVGSDAFTAENIPAPMTEEAISKVFNEYVMRDIDSYAYSRINDTIKEVVPGTGALKNPAI